MKKLFFSMVLMVSLLACNNEAESNKVGDSMRQDPTTGQPITTAPDTVGTSDSAQMVK
jgi:hypothetical protein